MLSQITFWKTYFRKRHFPNYAFGKYTFRKVILGIYIVRRKKTFGKHKRETILWYRGQKVAVGSMSNKRCLPTLISFPDPHTPTIYTFSWWKYYTIIRAKNINWNMIEIFHTNKFFLTCRRLLADVNVRQSSDSWIPQKKSKWDEQWLPCFFFLIGCWQIEIPI